MPHIPNMRVIMPLQPRGHRCELRGGPCDGQLLTTTEAKVFEYLEVVPQHDGTMGGALLPIKQHVYKWAGRHHEDTQLNLYQHVG